MQTIKDSKMCLVKNFQTLQTGRKRSFWKLALLTDFSASIEIAARCMKSNLDHLICAIVD